MNPSERTKEALLAKTETLCTSIVDNRKNDPWGGNGYLSTILRAVKLQDATDYSADETTEFPPALDYATSAQRELLIREQSAALIKTAQDISTLVRDLQELWLFGGLDTLSDPADEEANRKKAVAVAEMIEALAKQSPAGSGQNGVDAANAEG
ncbi:potassium ion channel Yvc1, partial [Pyrenophora tritici-repentis]